MTTTRKEGHMAPIYRQGDVLIVPVATIPAGTTKVKREHGRVVLAHDARPALLTSEDVSRILGVHRNTVRRLVRRGQLRAIHVGRLPRFRPEDLDAYLERGSPPPSVGSAREAVAWTFDVPADEYAPAVQT